MTLQLIRLKDVPERLNISEGTVRRLIRDGRLKTLKIGLRATVVTEADLTAYIESCRNSAQ
jgi:excisionase family DNA binding protein